MYVTAIVLAAGRGLRFNLKISKPLVEINSQALIVYCLNTLSKHPYIRDIIVVVNSRNLEGVLSKIRQYRIAKIKDVVLGGRLRQDSVRNGLKVMDSLTDLVLIHDGVRPFIDKELVSALVNAAKKSGAAIAGVPVKATIKKVKRQGLRSMGKPVVEKTINRNNLWEIQTPQVFRKDLILKAYGRFGNVDVTDDAMLVEKLGAKVSVVLGSSDNIKITTLEDLVIAEAILKAQGVQYAEPRLKI